MDRAPFSVEVEAGDYPVDLGIACYEQGACEDVAFAMLRFHDGDAVRWEMAHGTLDSPSDLADGEAYGYGVDSGTGCFVDDITAARFFEIMDGDECAAWGERLLGQLDANRMAGWTWADSLVEGAEGNLSAFTSGAGDGVYTSWSGHDSEERLVALVTDFRLRQDNRDSSLERAARPARQWWRFWGK